MQCFSFFICPLRKISMNFLWKLYFRVQMTLHERLWLWTVDNSRLEADLIRIDCCRPPAEGKRLKLILIWFCLQFFLGASPFLLVSTVAAVKAFPPSPFQFSSSKSVYRQCALKNQLTNLLSGRLTGRSSSSTSWQQSVRMMLPVLNLLLLLPSTLSIELPYIRCWTIILVCTTSEISRKIWNFATFMKVSVKN